MKNSLAFILAATAFGGVWAQSAPTVGSFQEARGLTTISQNQTMGNAISGSALTNGARVVTTSTGSGVIVLSNGCRVSLAPNQAVTIDTARSCDAMVASVQRVGPAMASDAPGVTSAEADRTFLGVVGTGAVAIILMNQQRTNRISGS